MVINGLATLCAERSFDKTPQELNEAGRSTKVSVVVLGGTSEVHSIRQRSVFSSAIFYMAFLVKRFPFHCSLIPAKNFVIAESVARLSEND